jgi:hypothetical protein
MARSRGLGDVYKRQKKDRLLQPFGAVDLSTLTDHWLVCANNLENAMLQAGAIPGVDYTIVDLFKLTAPIVTGQYRADKTALTY